MIQQPLNQTSSSQNAPVLREVTNLLYAGSSIGIIATLIIVSIFTFTIVTEVADSEKLYYWLAIVLLLACRAFDSMYWYLYLNGTDYEPRSPFLRFSFGLVATAIIWSVYAISIFDIIDFESYTVIMLICCAMTSGASTILAPSRKLCAVFVTLILIPISFWSLQDFRTEYVSVGVLGVAFWLFIISITVRSHSFVMHAISLKLSNIKLSEELQKEHDEIQHINDQLHRSNEALDHANASLELEVSKRTDDIHRLSHKDPMTGLMNRKGFLRFLDKQIINAGKMKNKLAVLFIDLDGFKKINDSLGHQIGDRVLEEVANRLKRYSETDNLGRWGGDEFVMILPYANDDTAMAVAHATRSSINKAIEIDSYSVSLDATIGISLYPDHANDAQQIIQLADLTMHEQKKRKPGGYALFESSYYDALQHEIMLQNGLRHAIEKGELSLCYQPIVKAKEKDVWAAEALLRWQFKDMPVSPAEFIPIAEKTGLINDIGNWVLHRACIDASQWGGLNTAVSVNVSVIQLMDDNFISTLDKVLQSSGLDPERLHIEITESVFADDPEKVNAQIDAVKQRQVQISIDDFGTGYSSLSQLESLRFDHIKIDRAFIQRLESGSDTIVRATMLIAKELESETVAEGIETKEVADQLAAMGVDNFQGYYFAKPMPNDDLVKWIVNYKSKA